MYTPQNFSETYLISEDVAYCAEEPTHTGTLPSRGVFHKGRVVWLERGIEGVPPDARISVYAEGVGVVILAARHLHRSS